MVAVLRQKHSTSLEWASANPVLQLGQIGLESDTGRFKIGDGISHWLELKYFVPEGVSEPEDPGTNSAELLAHINSLTPHPVYDDGPSFELLYQNAKV